MGFGFRIAPGLRVRVSSRGVRTSIGPRAARVHVGSGRTGLSTGAGPVTLYQSLGGTRRRGSQGRSASGRTGSSGAATAGEGWVSERNRLEAKAQEILNLHRAIYPPASKPLLDPVPPIDAKEIRAAFVKQALAGVGRFHRRARTDAKVLAIGAARTEVERARAEQATRQAERQRELDVKWRALVDNDPNEVFDALQVAFRETGTASAPLGLDQGELSLVVVVPGPEGVPDRRAAVTPTGRASVHKMTKTEHNSLYGELLCGRLLAAVRQALAAAPGVQAVRAVVVRAGRQRLRGAAGVECLVVARFSRDDLVRADWQGARAVSLVNRFARDLQAHQAGRAKEFQPLDSYSQPWAATLLEGLSLNDDGSVEAHYKASARTEPAAAAAASPVELAPTVPTSPKRAAGPSTAPRTEATSPKGASEVPSLPKLSELELPSPPSEFPRNIAHTTRFYVEVLEPQRKALARGVLAGTNPARRYEDIVLHANVARLELKEVESSVDKAPTAAVGTNGLNRDEVDLWLAYLTWAKGWRQGLIDYSSSFASLARTLRPQLSEDQRGAAEGDHLGRRYEDIKAELRAALEKEAERLKSSAVAELHQLGPQG